MRLVMLRIAPLLITVAALALPIKALAQDSWPPALPGAVNGTVKLTSQDFLKTPESVKERMKAEGTVKFTIAKGTPTVELAYHQDLGPDAATRRLWSSWGDICLASDGSVYMAIGDHGDAVGGDARAFMYRWDPKTSRLKQVVDFNVVAPRKKDQPAWSKVHAKIDEGPDGKIYANCTLNDGNRASREDYKFGGDFPGGQIYQYDPETGKSSVYTSLPPRRCSATSLVDPQRGIWWCNLEAGEGNALWGFDLKTKKTVLQTADGVVSFNRAFALLNDGSLIFNGVDGLSQLDAATGKITVKKSSFGESPGMRAASLQAKDGYIYGSTHKLNELFSYHPEKDELKLLGPTWLTGEYTTVTVLAPDEKFVYYLPGAHGKAWQYGTPVIQYNIASGKRKVIAFLSDVLADKFGFVPGGTYGVKLSDDGGTLYVNFNGHPIDANRPAKMKPIGFGVTAFAAIHIPESERR
jgi:sugar lactone lactonase YvrE